MIYNNSPRTKDQIVAIILPHLDTIKDFGVKKIGLFGSVVSSGMKDGSDIDLLVELEDGQETFKNITDLHFFLEELLGKKVDIVTSGGLSPYIAPYILQEVEYIE